MRGTEAGGFRNVHADRFVVDGVVGNAPLCAGTLVWQCLSLFASQPKCDLFSTFSDGILTVHWIVWLRANKALTSRTCSH